MTAHKDDHLYEEMCFLGGGSYRGLQEGMKEIGLETLVLFNSPATGTTLALPTTQMSACNVRTRIAESDAMYEEYAEKASRFVLAQFARKEVTCR